MLPRKVVQIGVTGETQLVPDFRENQTLDQLADLVKTCRFWISCDSFFQHFAWDFGIPGAVLWGPSDPNIYGYSENLNITKSKEFKIPNQFLMWTMVEPSDNFWIPPDEAIGIIRDRWPW